MPANMESMSMPTHEEIFAAARRYRKPRQERTAANDEIAAWWQREKASQKTAIATVNINAQLTAFAKEIRQLAEFGARWKRLVEKLTGSENASVELIEMNLARLSHGSWPIGRQMSGREFRRWVKAAVEMETRTKDERKPSGRKPSGRPRKYPQEVARAIELLRAGDKKDYVIWKTVRKEFPAARIPTQESFMKTVRRHLRSRTKRT